MKSPFKFAFVFFVSMFCLHYGSALSAFDVENCTMDEIQHEKKDAIHEGSQYQVHRYLFEGVCGSSSYPIVLSSLFYDLSNLADEPDRYRELIRIGESAASRYSYLLGSCEGNPVLSETSCRWYFRLDTTNTIHDKYNTAIARYLLSPEQLADLESEGTLKITKDFAQQSRSKALTIPKSEALASASAHKAVPAAPFTKWEASADSFRVMSPAEGQIYPVAPLLEFVVPERADVMYRVNVCQVPLGGTPCEQHENTVTASELQCDDAGTSCRFKGALNVPISANRHYMLIIRPVPLKYDPVIVEFDLSSMVKKADVTRKATIKKQ